MDEINNIVRKPQDLIKQDSLGAICLILKYTKYF